MSSNETTPTQQEGGTTLAAEPDVGAPHAQRRAAEDVARETHPPGYPADHEVPLEKAVRFQESILSPTQDGTKMPYLFPMYYEQVPPDESSSSSNSKASSGSSSANSKPSEYSTDPSDYDIGLTSSDYDIAFTPSDWTSKPLVLEGLSMPVDEPGSRPRKVLGPSSNKPPLGMEKPRQAYMEPDNVQCLHYDTPVYRAIEDLQATMDDLVLDVWDLREGNLRQKSRDTIEDLKSVEVEGAEDAAVRRDAGPKSATARTSGGTQAQGNRPVASHSVRSRSLPGHTLETTSRQLHGSALRRIGGLGLVALRVVDSFIHELLDILETQPPVGYRRVSWTCTCGTELSGDFLDEDPAALHELVSELQNMADVKGPSGEGLETPHGGEYTRQHTSGSVWPRPPNSNSVIFRRPVVRPSEQPPPQSPYVPPGLDAITTQTSSGSSAQTREHNLSQGHTRSMGISTPVTTARHPGHPPRQRPSLGFLEVCINKGRYLKRLQEIDLSYIGSDGQLFHEIWNRYRIVSGSGLRRIFLTARGVHFVMFSLAKGYHDIVSIHEKPDIYPPPEEVDSGRYHYRRPKLLMTSDTFLYLLNHARRRHPSDHWQDVWLQRLPKKLNQRILEAFKLQQQSAASQQAADQQQQQQQSDEDDLVFGWGVHIIEGPNHAGLSIVVAVGLAVSFLVSGLVVGIAKTQEQGFGIGAFFLAVLTCGMSAMYFTFLDH